MKKYIYTWVLFVALVCCASVNAQTPQQNLDKYWHYRYRLNHYFTQLGSKTGMSMPAAVRNGSDDSRPTNQIYWVDAGRNLGWYLMMLATEYRLLTDNGQNADETVKELYYALHTVFRLDSLYIDEWNSQGNSFSSPFTIPPATFPGEGIELLDDADFGSSCFSVILPTDPINAGLYSGYPLKKNISTCPDNNDYYSINRYSTYWPVAEYGDGKVGPVEVVSGHNEANLSTDVMSADNYITLLMGLQMVVKLTYDAPQGFTGCSNPYGYNRTPYAMATQLGYTILNYIGNTSDWNLYLPNDHNVGSSFGYWDFVYFEYPMSSLGSIFGVPLSYNFGTPTYWENYTPAAANIGCGGMQQLEMGVEVAAMTNSPGYYSSACSMISAFGNNTDPGACFPSNKGNYYTPGSGWDVCYEAIHDILNDGGCSPDLCEMETILSSAPPEGPFCHIGTIKNDGSYESCPDFAPGWGSRGKFTWGEFQDDYGNWGEAGNYNGLDYMVLYNLYRLEVGTYNSVHTNYPYFDPNYGYIGFASVPAHVYYPCSNIIVNQMDVHDASLYGHPGGVVIEAGQTNMIDFKPLSNTTITVENGGYMDAYCPLTCTTACGNPDEQYYYFEPDPDPNSYTDADQRVAYQKTPEFDTAYSTNAFNNYPNPFTSQTTIDFSLANSEAVSLYITNSSGQIVATLINNESYTSGGHVVNYNGSNLAAGTYLGVLVTKEGKRTVKMVKTK